MPACYRPLRSVTVRSTAARLPQSVHFIVQRSEPPLDSKATLLESMLQILIILQTPLDFGWSIFFTKRLKLNLISCTIWWWNSYIAQNIAERRQKYFQYFIAIEILAQNFCQILQNIPSQHYNFKFLKYFLKQIYIQYSLEYCRKIPLKCADLTHLNNIYKCCKWWRKIIFSKLYFLNSILEILFNLEKRERYFCI